MDEHGCPADYDELTREYFGLMREMARRKVGPKNAEDAAQNILVRIIETDGLAKYDPSRGARFGTFLMSFVRLKLRDERDKVARVWDHEAPLDVVKSTAVVEVSYEQSETSLDLRRVIARVADVEISPSSGIRVGEVVAAIEEDFERTDTISSEGLARRLGVSVSTAKRWRQRVVTALRDELAYDVA